MYASNGVNGGHPVVVGITGASGSLLARAAIDVLLDMGVPVIASASSAARMVWREEMDESFGAALERWTDSGGFTHYASGDLAAPIASGTYPTGGMVVVPASMNSIASIANGLSGNLLLRAADVCLKERRPLVLVPRETPLHSIHLENMLTLSRMGAVIAPPEPAFYLKPRGIGDIVRFTVGRIMVALGLDESLPGDLQYTGEA